MFKNLLNAKKNKRAIPAVVAVFLVMSAINAESFGVTIDFYGMAQYASSGLSFVGDYVPVLPAGDSSILGGTFTGGSTAQTDALNSGAPYDGILAIAYELDYDVPEWDQPYNWTVDVMAKVEGSYSVDATPNDNSDDPVEEVISEELVEHFDLGEGSLEDFLADKDNIVDQIAGFPLSDYLPGDYQIIGDDESGVIYAAITDPAFFGDLFPAGAVLGDGDVTFGGQIVLESATAPEPASMILFGSGLFGLMGYRRKFTA